MLVVADSSVLIAYHQIDQLAVLRDLYTSVVVPPAVARETAPSLGNLPDWIAIVAPSTDHALTLRLDDGEREALSLAMEILPGAVLIDDLAARRVARDLAVPIIGSAGVLVDAKSAGLIDRVSPILHAMRAGGLYLSDEIADEVLRRAGEA